jgi:hypothetical protein
MTCNCEHSAGAADDSGGLPVPSAEDQEMLLDVWREALAQVLADRNSEWEQTVRSSQAESRAAIAELRATIGDMRGEIFDHIERRVFEKMAQIRQPADGAPGPRGEPGPVGRLHSVTPYVADTVHYAGNVVAFAGATFQARCDTAKPPGGDDWTCLATAGKHGIDGRSFQIRGTYNEQQTIKRWMWWRSMDRALSPRPTARASVRATGGNSSPVQAGRASLARGASAETGARVESTAKRRRLWPGR